MVFRFTDSDVIGFDLDMTLCRYRTGSMNTQSMTLTVFDPSRVEILYPVGPDAILFDLNWQDPIKDIFQWYAWFMSHWRIISFENVITMDYY